MAFEVGDLVRIVGPSVGDDAVERIGFTNEMNEFVGSVFAILDGFVRNGRDNLYRLREDDVGWTWHENWLEPAYPTSSDPEFDSKFSSVFD